MKVIFLDVDGVLNSSKTKERINGYVGIDDYNVVNLKKIVDETGTDIVLCSSWKNNWKVQDTMGKYLTDILATQNLVIMDKTTDIGGNRGEGIHDWLAEHDVEKWVVLDDDIFGDYEKYGVMEHLVTTSYYVGSGLEEEHVEKAIKLLNE